MSGKLFVFRHAETSDNANDIFSGWRNPGLTQKGLLQAERTAGQLREEEITYAFTSHLKRARETLGIVLNHHPKVPILVDDRIIERCYGTLQGKSKTRVSRERPQWYAKVHRGYAFPPPEGESLRMVYKRVSVFLEELEGWMGNNPGNVAISCHGNSMRPIRKIYEHLSITEMCEIENPQDIALTYQPKHDSSDLVETDRPIAKPDWRGILVPLDVKLATDPRNPLKAYY